MRPAMYVLVLALCIALWECTAGQVAASSTEVSEQKKEDKETTSSEEVEDNSTTSTEDETTTSTAAGGGTENTLVQGSLTGVSQSNGSGSHTLTQPDGEGAVEKLEDGSVKDSSKTASPKEEPHLPTTTVTTSQTTITSPQSATAPAAAVAKQPGTPEPGHPVPPGPQVQLANARDGSDPTKVTEHSVSTGKNTGLPKGERDRTPSHTTAPVMHQATNMDRVHQGTPTKALQGELTNLNGSPKGTANTEPLTPLATVPSPRKSDTDTKEIAVHPRGAESNVDSTTTPDITEDIASPDDPKKIPSAPKTPVPPVSNALPLHHSVEKTDGSLCSSSLFALATLAVAAAAPAH